MTLRFKKFFLNVRLFLIVSLSFSFNTYAGYLVNETLVDEFTDEESVALTFTADDDMEIFRKWGQIICIEDSLVLALEDTDNYHFESYVLAKFRFDRNEAYEIALDYDMETSTAYTYSEEKIFQFLDQLRGSKSFLIQLESSDVPMRFSNIYNSEKTVSTFIERLVTKTGC